MKQGIELALGNGTIPQAWFDSIADDDAEAERLAYRANTARAEAKHLTGPGW